jgi:predicted acylesterase/phospholipase RssA
MGGEISDHGRPMARSFSVVLSGGGCKVFWANGILQTLGPELPPIDHWAGSSAGGAFALAHVARRFDTAFDRFLELVEINQRNFYPRRALRRERPFPHNMIYRESVRHLLGDGGFARVREGAPVHILLCYVLAGHKFVPTSFAALQKFADRRRRGVLHGPRELPPGIGTQVVCSREAMDVDQLLDWTLMSSTIPPITPIQRRHGRRYLDGGLIDNIPIRALPEHARTDGAKILCLVSHNVRVPERPVRLPGGAEVLYLAAQSPLPVRVWDYTSPERVTAAIELGRSDAQTLRERVLAFADSTPAARTG